MLMFWRLCFKFTTYGPRDVSPPTFEVTGTNCIWSPSTAATGCRFLAGLCAKLTVLPQTSLLNLTGQGKKSRKGSGVEHHHHHHHFICPIIQQYAHLHEYNSRIAGQQGPIRTPTAALKRSIKTVTGCIFYHK